MKHDPQPSLSGTPQQNSIPVPDHAIQSNRGARGDGICPVCLGSTLVEIRGKLQCHRCHTICKTCCEGGRG